MYFHPHAPDATWQHIRKLSFAGLVPFVFLALCLWLVNEELHPYVALSMQGYGAVVVSYLGGIHWGAGLRDAVTTRNAPKLPFTWGVVPALLAWVGVMMPAFAGLPLLGFALIGCYVMDRRIWPSLGLAAWLPMRLQLTIIASLSCFLAAGAT